MKHFTAADQSGDTRIDVVIIADDRDPAPSSLFDETLPVVTHRQDGRAGGDQPEPAVVETREKPGQRRRIVGIVADNDFEIGAVRRRQRLDGLEAIGLTIARRQADGQMNHGQLSCMTCQL